MLISSNQNQSIMGLPSGQGARNANSMIGFGTGSSRSGSASDLDDHSRSSSCIFGRDKDGENMGGGLPTFGGVTETSG